MNVYNADKTGVTIVHRSGKVNAELGQRHLYSITSAERGRIHTVLSCISAMFRVASLHNIYTKDKSP